MCNLLIFSGVIIQNEASFRSTPRLFSTVYWGVVSVLWLCVLFPRVPLSDNLAKRIITFGAQISEHRIIRDI